MKPGYVPDTGDIVWLHFDPQAGHEQAGHCPALVLSPARYNGLRGMMICCPMTSRIKGYPFEVIDSDDPPSAVPGRSGEEPRLARAAGGEEGPSLVNHSGGGAGKGARAAGTIAKGGEPELAPLWCQAASADSHGANTSASLFALPTRFAKLVSRRAWSAGM